MRARNNTIINAKTGVVTVEDWTGLAPLSEDKASSIRDVRAMLARKIAAVNAAFSDNDRLLMVMVRYMRLTRKSVSGSLTAGETTWLNAVDSLMARVWALRQAADDIETEINAKATNAEVFDHNDALATNPIWPE